MTYKCWNCNCENIIPPNADTVAYNRGIIDAIYEIEKLPTFMGFWISKTSAFEKIFNLFKEANAYR